jgi:hypothetical protein
MTIQDATTKPALPGLLSDIRPGQIQSWGLLDAVALFSTEARPDYAGFVSPLQHLKLVRVPTYGTLILENGAKSGTVIAPMHIGFFQEGAQNHATSRVLLLDAEETLTVTDCFCIQASQGGLLKEAQQRFIILPLSLRKAALSKRGENGYSRLWEDIDLHNRRYGIARGGHLERFLRPYFHRIMLFRHAFELLPQQVGAAYFVAGNLVGVEVTPNAAYWSDVGPILNIYCYGTAALLGARHQLKPERQALDIEGLTNIDDLAHRLEDARQLETMERINLIEALSNLDWNRSDKKHGLHVVNLEQGEWVGQMVKDGANMLYLSLFRDVPV